MQKKKIELQEILGFIAVMIAISLIFSYLPDTIRWLKNHLKF